MNTVFIHSLTEPSILYDVILHHCHRLHLRQCGCTIEAGEEGRTAAFGMSSVAATVMFLPATLLRCTGARLNNALRSPFPVIFCEHTNPETPFQA